jgi:predicted enzyme related to lactoylglutathione lyase
VKRVTGIGGIFFKAKDPVALCAWYKEHLGIDAQGWCGAIFNWADDSKFTEGMTVWAVKKSDSDPFDPSKAPFMINYRVADLASLLAALRSEGCNVLEKVDDSEFGKFGWVIDPEGNKVELWQPPEGEGA